MNLWNDYCSSHRKNVGLDRLGKVSVRVGKLGIKFYSRPNIVVFDFLFSINSPYVIS